MPREQVSVAKPSPTEPLFDEVNGQIVNRPNERFYRFIDTIVARMGGAGVFGLITDILLEETETTIRVRSNAFFDISTIGHWSIENIPVTANAQEINILDGALITTPQLNYLSNISAPQAGMLLIGSTSANRYLSNTLTEGVGTVITNGNGTITIGANLTANEFAQLQNINNSVISANNWENLSSLNQPLSTTSDVTFNTVTAQTLVANSISGSVDANDIFGIISSEHGGTSSNLSGSTGVLHYVSGVGLANATTTDLPEGSNLYFTVSRVRSNISAGAGITYNSTSGVITANAAASTVSNVTGTANQIDTVFNSGNILVSLSNTLILPGTLSITGVTTIGTTTPQGTNKLTVAGNTYTDVLTANSLINGSATNIILEPSGRYTSPNKPAFFARTGSAQANVTGDGTLYTISYNTEQFDRGNIFSGNTLTIPVTGVYQINHYCSIFNLTAAHNDAYLQISTAGTFNRTFRNAFCNPGVLAGASSTSYTLNMGIVANFAAGDTVQFKVQVSGSTKTINIDFGSTVPTYVCGFLVG